MTPARGSSTDRRRPNPVLDHDGDRYSNLEEYIAGTDPTNAASVFRLGTSVDATGEFQLAWPSVAGRVYSVWSTTSLTNGFSLLEGDIAADPPVNQYTPTNTVEPAAFYRIRVSLPDE